MSQIGAPLVGSYNYGLVSLSVLIAISASNAAFDLGGRVTVAQGWARSAWLAGGATAMGLGIWSMHFTGMLAFKLPVPVAYDWPTVLASLLAAILAAGVALFVVSRKEMGRVQALTGSVVMGLGIAGMHYIGMAAMRLSAERHYSSPLVAFSVLIAVGASLAALVLTFGFRKDFGGTTLAKVMSAAAMGAAITLMHYTGMMSASFIPSSVAPDLLHAVSVSSLGLSGIAIGTLVVQGAATLTSSVDRRLARQAQELQTSERFRQIADFLRDVLLLGNADLSEVLFVNPAYQAIWGRTVESLHTDAKSWLEGVHAEDRQHVQEALRRLVDGEPLDDLECRVVRPDGSISWVRLRARPVRDSQGHPYRIVGSFHEFTMRKRAEMQARMLIEAIPQQIWSGPPDGTIDYCNERWRSETGLGLEDLRGDGWQTMLHPDDRDRVIKAWRESVANGKPYEQEERHRSADGRYRWFLSRGLPLRDDDRRILRWYGTNTDIEDRKQAEEELLRLSAKLLRSQDEERRRIARDLHDSTGQNLVALATMLGQLNRSLPSVERKSRTLLSQCQELADQCIREVRTLSYALHPPGLDEAGLEDAIRDYAKGFTKRSGILVELELSARLERMARDVEMAIFRVVQESLTNIQRHSGSRQARIRIDRDSSSLTVEINDDGRGILGSNLPRGKDVSKFEPGVGIPSMQERVKLIGGRLEINSTSHGTTVRVMVPLGGLGLENTAHSAR